MESDTNIGNSSPDNDVAMVDGSRAEDESQQLAATADMPGRDPAKADAAAATTKRKSRTRAIDRKPKRAAARRKESSQSTIASAPPRCTTRRRNQTKVYTVGKQKQKDSFINIDNPEATIAAYCGFNDIGTFRNFLLSPWVISFYVRYLEYSAHSHKTTISLLDDAPYEEYWQHEAEVDTIYPLEKIFVNKHEKKTQLSYGAGLVAWQFLRQIRKGVLKYANEDAAASFSALTKRQLPQGVKAPTKSNLPNFGPFEQWDETELEPLNRCLCLFAHLKYVTSPTQWDTRFHGRTPWNSSVLVGIDYVPNWMVGTEVAERQAPDEVQDSELIMQTRTLEVRWKCKSKNQKNIQFVNELQDRDNYDEVPKKVKVLLNEQMTGPELRDKIREAFYLHQHDGQLEQLILNAPSKDEEEDMTFNVLNCDWDTVTKVIFDYPDEDTPLYFTVLMRVRDDTESPWENEGPPSPLAPFLTVKDSDVAPKEPMTAAEREQVYRTVFQMTVPSLETPFEPLKLFKNDRARMTKFFDGYDVDSQQGRRNWQLKILDEIAGTQPAFDQDPSMLNFKRFRAEIATALNRAAEDGRSAAIDLEEDEAYVGARERYYAYQSATGGTDAHVGPPIETSVSAFDMIRQGSYDDVKEFYSLTHKSKGLIKRSFRAWQVNGLAWALSRLYRKIPLDEKASPEAKKAAGLLTQPYLIPGLMIQDMTGAGKTSLLLLILSHCTEPVEYEGGQRVCKPFFLQVPKNLVRQWAEEIMEFWPYFTLIIGYDDGQLPPFIQDHVVSTSAIRAWPKPDLWPAKLRYIFDRTDAKNCRTIYLTSYETHVTRSLWQEEKTHPAIPYSPPLFDDKRKEAFKSEEWVEVIDHSHLKDVFSIAISDEATKVKTPGGRRHVATRLLCASRLIFATATPMHNTGTVCYLFEKCFASILTKLVYIGSD